MTTIDQQLVRLRLALGDGKIARRSDALLFVSGNGGADRSGAHCEPLTTAFMTAETSTAAADAVCAASIQAMPDRPPFAIVHWAERTRMIVFGGLTLHTNQPSAPTLSAEGSATWVEHTLLQTPDEITIELEPSLVDHTTDLGLGVVAAGGFALSLAPDIADGPSQPDATVTAIFPTADAAEAPAIVFDSGQILTIDRGFLIGRKPDPTRGDALLDMQPYEVDDTKLSRNHLVVDRSGATVLVTDCGSLNGSVLISEPGAVPLHLEPSVPVALGPEAVLYLGDQIIRLSQ